MGNDSAPEIDIRIDSEGAWFYRNAKMMRQEIIGLFYEHLRQDACGKYYIEIGQQRCAVDVDDTAYVVWALRWARREAAEDFALLLLSDGSSERLDPGTLRIGENHIPYCRVKNGRFEARFSRPAYYEFTERLHYDLSNDTYFVLLNNQQYPLSHKRH
jgi:uncharacterized protein